MRGLGKALPNQNYLKIYRFSWQCFAPTEGSSDARIIHDTNGLDVIAEGIETAEQLKWLQQIGCKYGQGYLFNKPLPINEVERIYLKN